jgi:arylsulfatase A-like enzyme
MSGKPNIVLIVVDHQAYYRHGWDGGVRPQTPNFDRLASEGISFNRSYCATPLCGPARRTLLTGLYTHNHKNYYNYSEAPYDHEIYFDRLAEHGYRNYYFGKWHAGPGTPFDFHCEGFSDTDYGNPYITKEYHQYLKSRGLPRAEHLVERAFWNDLFLKLFPYLQIGNHYKCNRSWCGEHASGLTLTPKETHESFFLANLACDKLTELALAADDQPFHLRVDFWGPHQPHFPTKEFAELYDPDGIEEYGSFQDLLNKKPSFFFEDTNQPLSDMNNRFRVPSPLTWKEWQKIIARAYAHITMVDAAGGIILDKLDQLGLSDNTIVIWTADHGDALASHGGRFDKGSYMTEEVIRVPLAIRYPKEISPRQVSEELVCSMDLPITILDVAGTGFENKVDGQSLLPLFNGEANGWREDLMVETFGHGYGKFHNGRLVLAGNYKYITYAGEISELYDLKNDPYELHNLIDEPQYKKNVEDMQKRLKVLQHRSGDNGFDDKAFQKAIEADGDLLTALARRRETKLRERKAYL